MLHLDSKKLVQIDAVLKYTLNEMPETLKLIDHYKKIKIDNLTYCNIFEEISWIVYSSGFRNDILVKYWPYIRIEFDNFNIENVVEYFNDVEKEAKRICNNSGFHNLNKTKWCINNAKRIMELNNEKENYGGFKSYLIELSQKEPYYLVEMAPSLVNDFKLKGIGNVTIFHLLKNLGFNIFKPDIHITRLLSNFGLINKENYDNYEIFHILQLLSKSLGLKICELDTILFTYGRLHGDTIL